MFILGTDDSINTCDCCGKSNLKHTVTVDVDGEIMHYGSTCATRHTGLKSGQIKKQIEVRQEAVRNSAQNEFHSTQEYLNHQAKLRQLNRDGVRPGKEFHAAQLELDLLATAKKREIAQKYSLEMHAFY